MLHIFLTARVLVAKFMAQALGASEYLFLLPQLKYNGNDITNSFESEKPKIL